MSSLQIRDLSNWIAILIRRSASPGDPVPITFTIPHPFLRSILTELRRQPYHVAVGPAGLNRHASGAIDLLARSFEFVHEGALRRRPNTHPIRFELGFVPFTLNRPDVWQAVAFAARIEGDLPPTPTCSILLGSGDEVGLFTGIYSRGDQIEPLRTMQIIGPGMPRLAAVDFQALQRHSITPGDAERWSRLIGALGGHEVWQRLTSLTFCLIGAGRTGSLVAATLAKQGVRTLCLLDPDIVERHNLDAMDAVTERDLGRHKVRAIAENLQHDLPYTQITAFPHSVLTTEARMLAKTADVLICCVDDDTARVVSAALACCYEKPLLDIGTGIFTQHSRPQEALGRRRMGADIRLILPGDGCLLCWGGVANPDEALQQWRTVVAANSTENLPRRPWQHERAGSLRSLNATAAHFGIRLLEDLIAGRLTQSRWLRLEVDDHGLPSLHSLPGRILPSCALCALVGTGDLLGH